MSNPDWKKPPKDENDHRIREKALSSIDVINLLEVDPRDEIFGDLLYCHPNPFTTSSQIDGGVGTYAVLAQLIVIDMISSDLIARNEFGELQITEAGLVFANARLVGPDVNSIYRVRDNAPAYGPLSVEASIALKHLILHGSPYVEHLLTDVYHPEFGRATFD